MANFDTIKTTIDANINTNGNQAITGAVMNSVLKQMVDSTDAELTELESEVSNIIVLSNNKTINKYIKELYIKENAGFKSSDVGSIKLLLGDNGYYQFWIKAKDGNNLIGVNVQEGGYLRGIYEISNKIYVFFSDIPNTPFNTDWIDVELSQKADSLDSNPIIKNFIQDITDEDNFNKLTEITNNLCNSGVTSSSYINSIIKELYIDDSVSWTYSDVASMRVKRNVDGYLQVTIRDMSHTNLFFKNVFTPDETQDGVKEVSGLYFCFGNMPPYPQVFDIDVDCKMSSCCKKLELNPIIQKKIEVPELVDINNELNTPIVIKSSKLSSETLFEYNGKDGYVTIKGNSTSLFAFYLSVNHGEESDVVWSSGNKQAGDFNLSINITDILADNQYANSENFKSIRIWFNKFYDGTISITDVRATNKIAHAINISKESSGIKTIWYGKNIGWWGTSIPAGKEEYSVPFKGYKITAKHHMDGIITTNGVSCILEYPVMTGVLLGANVYNEAMGSSQAAKSITGSDLLIRCKSLASKVEDILSLLFGCYNINWNDKTYSRNNSNQFGITTFLADSSWEQLMDSFAFCIRLSYEISIISRYLIKDAIEHRAFVKKIFGTYYDTLAEHIDIESLCAYRADLDLFVLDHGTNDGNYASDSNSTDTTTFEGAYNMIISTILQYKPSARIVVLSSFTRWRTSVNDVEVQKNMASRWQLPYIDMSVLLPLTKKVNILSRGYWDSNNIWHDDGFTWSENGVSYTTNNDIFNDSLSSIKSEFEPKEIDGIWYWKTTPMRTWLYDNLHPHSDRGGRICKEYARILSEFFVRIGNTL